MPSLTSSQESCPTSLTYIRPVLEKSKVNGLRSPSAQMARFAPVAVEENGLSVGMLPSASRRRILPIRLPRLCAVDPSPLSPVVV